MTYSAGLTASVVRSVLVVIVGLLAARQIAVWLSPEPSRRARTWLSALVAMPFLTPNLVVGYGYRGLSLNLLRWPWLNESIYFSLICFELVPAAVWMLLNSGSPAVSPEAKFCAALGRAQAGSPLRSAWQWFRLWRRGPASQYFAPAALLFILSFQEAELAALMQVAGWTERVFTDHTRGLPAIETIRLVRWPMLIQAVVLWPLLRFLRDIRESTGEQSTNRLWDLPLPAHQRAVAGFGITWSTIALVAVLVVPLSHMVRSSAKSARTVFLQPMWFRELADALLIAVTCGAAAWLLAATLKRLKIGRRSVAGAVIPFASLTPGLMGTLALGLTTAAAFQRFSSEWAYTPLPLIVAEIAWLWPRALLVWRTLESRTRVMQHQTRLLCASPLESQRRQGWQLWWTLRGRAVWGGAILVGWWCYLETMLPTLLSSPGFQPAPMVLYNHLHYGQIAALGVKLMMILAAPAILLGVPWVIASRVGRQST